MKTVKQLAAETTWSEAQLWQAVAAAKIRPTADASTGMQFDEVGQEAIRAQATALFGIEIKAVPPPFEIGGR